MTEGFIIGIGRDALWTVLLISAPILGLGLIVGLVVSILQATTQIQDATLAFVPKILAVLVALALFGGWMLTSLVDFTQRIFQALPTVLG